MHFEFASHDVTVNGSRFGRVEQPRSRGIQHHSINGRKLFIDGQRPYSWEVSTAMQLVDDVSEALRDIERKDVLYVLVQHPVNKLNI